MEKEETALIEIAAAHRAVTLLEVLVRLEID